MSDREKWLDMIYEGPVSGLAELLATRGPLLIDDPFGTEFVSKAVWRIWAAILESLGARPDPDIEVVNALVDGARKPLDLLIEAGVPVDGPVANDLPPLHVAAQLPTDVILRDLVGLGANVNRLVAAVGGPADVAFHRIPREYLEGVGALRLKSPGDLS
ncbi:MAG: hypothetical protein EVA89_20860 [Sandaracinaceae bacterium]|nr:MAG: hypothetical protein EVA89_20860 [Sandaracinaceae bacterium]